MLHNTLLLFAQEMMNEVAPDENDPRVDFSDFLVIMARRGPSNVENGNEVLNAFRVFDKHDTGVVSSSVLKKVMTQFGMKLEDEEVDELFRLSNCVDDSGQIKYKELIETYF